MKIIILGPPGTGKGTQAKIIAKEFGLKHISSDILREEVKKNTDIGREVKKYMDSGNLIPEDLFEKVIKKNLPKDNFILDGAPRTINQAKWMHKIFEPDYVIWITSSKDIIIKRLIGRARIEGRKDDTPEVIENRFMVYEKETKPLLDFYGKRVVKIDGNGTPEEIFEDVKKVLKR